MMARKQNPTEHRMTRRSHDNDYSQPGMYHVTLRVADGLGQPFGRVAGDARLADGIPGAPYVELTAIGRMVAYELRNSIGRYYSMVEVQDYVVMPEHMHFILEVHGPIVSRQGKKAHLGQVIAGFKKGCNRRYWEISGQAVSGSEARRGKPAGTNGGNGRAAESGMAAGSGRAAGNEMADSSCPAVFPQGDKVPSRASTGRAPLFAEQYVDVMPLHSGQLQTQRLYIRNNPRSRLLRSTHRDILQTQRGAIDTALYMRPLKKYLRQNCRPWQVTPEKLELIENRLLTEDTAWRGKPARTNTGTNARSNTGANTGANSAPNGGTTAANFKIACDSYGSRALLKQRLLPVVCHGCDKARFPEQKERCLTAAREGAVLVSARIAPGEKEIIDAAIEDGASVVLVIDNGMPEVYHPSEERIGLCLAGKLLIVTPWQYHYRTAEEQVSVTMCKTMNCVVQALCRQKDSWWKRADKGR